ncbi:ATP-binding cassette domain-containing protein [Paenibacillus senegalensis]|uniref:ATP-binding cassette domain-containing protein n=1 Tax=Paenibacillus senegalensis TaxID=1465766 RepID=UPI0002889DFB|nr:ABC transporter ATP-binding protein [Paenibacillus senegalensis]
MTFPLQYNQVLKRKADFELGPIDLTLQDGLAYALAGANGSGKTTLMKLTMNLLKPDSGYVELYGQRIAGNEDEIKTRIAFVPDPMEGCEMFTLHQLVQMLSPWYPNWNSQRFDQCREQFKLPVHKRYSMLSQGNKKKVALTLALSTGSPILLLDEPTNGLDMPSRSYLKHMLAEDAETMGRTVLFSTHSPEDVKEFADAVLLMREGRCKGPYDKDELLVSWSRIWLAEGSAASGVLNLPGVVECSGEESPIVQLISRDRDATLAELGARNIAIMKDQPLQLKEILEYMHKLDA